MNLNKRLMGEWLMVEFWDHCIEEGRKTSKKKPILCKLSGYLVGISQGHLILSPWMCGSDPKTKAANAEEYVIVRDAVTRWAKIETRKWNEPS